MNIIICGAGRVGFTIAKQLTEQNHSITIIDQSSEDIQKINDSLDVKAIVGKATMPSVLEKAHNDETDMIIAVTKNDEINMLICQIAYSLFKIPKKIARIRSQDYLNPKFAKIYNKENLPIDVIISPELEIAKSIQPSSRGELEITDVNRVYLEQSQLSVEKMSRGFAWLDTGSHESLLDAANFIETIQRRQGLMVCCPEEIAYSKGWITEENLENLARLLKKNGYGQYLLRLIQQS